MEHVAGIMASGLTPAHHLRGAAQNREPSAKVGQWPAFSKALAAPRQVHALVRPLLSRRSRVVTEAERQGPTVNTTQRVYDIESQRSREIAIARRVRGEEPGRR